jgi:hypothetical protein
MSLALAVVVFALFLSALLWSNARRARRTDFVRGYRFPQGLYERVRKRRPELTPKDFQLVANGLRQFFLAHLLSGRRFVSMPSQAADDLWHEFILYTKHYEQFCRRAFGRFMHHTPALALGPERRNNEGLRRTWWFACQQENIDPRRPSRLPLLFALDAKLGIGDGFVYKADCEALRRAGAKTGGATVHCGGDFGSASIDGCTDGFGDGGSGSSDGSAGDGGSGCGGGGCGGGGGD